MSTTTTKMNINDFQSKVMEEISAIREIVKTLKTSPTTTLAAATVAGKKERKPRKPRDPDAPKNPWIVFTGKVRAALKAAGKPAGKECQQFAKYLKSEFPDAYQMDEAEILAAHESWTPPPSEPKETKEEPKSEGEAESKPKTMRKPMTDEQKEKMRAGRLAAKQRREAEAGVVATTSSPEEVEEEGVAAAAEAPTPAPTLRPLPFNRKKYLWDPEGNGMWLAEKDGSKGTWAGVLAKDKKSIDASASDYTA